MVSLVYQGETFLTFEFPGLNTAPVPLPSEGAELRKITISNFTAYSWVVLLMSPRNTHFRINKGNVVNPYSVMSMESKKHGPFLAIPNDFLFHEEKEVHPAVMERASDSDLMDTVIWNKMPLKVCVYPILRKDLCKTIAWSKKTPDPFSGLMSQCSCERDVGDFFPSNPVYLEFETNFTRQ